MSVVLAAIDNSAATQPVLELARELARLRGAAVETVHVDEAGTSRWAAAIAGAEHLLLHRRQGEVATAIAATAKERDAIAVVLGARGLPAGASPAGHVTMDLVQALDIAVAVAPPQAEPRPIVRVLVAVEGDGESHGLRHLARHFARSKLEIFALHVFEPDNLPLFADQPVLETEAWVEEFGRRSFGSLDGGVRLEVRVGDAARKLLEAAQELGVDLVVIAWHRDLSHGHGRLVRAVLAGADVPVLLVPLPRQA
jgi:nucleotide-binding universal stress UspA family protein